MGPYRSWFWKDDGDKTTRVNRANDEEKPSAETSSVGGRLLAVNKPVQEVVEDWQKNNPQIPIVGVIAFSDGALVAALLIWQQQTGRPPWFPKMDVAMFICCYYTEEATDYIKTESPDDQKAILMNVPSVHLQGLQDFALQGSRKLAATHFSPGNADILQFQGGHHIPKRSLGASAVLSRRQATWFSRKDNSTSSSPVSTRPSLLAVDISASSYERAFDNSLFFLYSVALKKPPLTSISHKHVAWPPASGTMEKPVNDTSVSIGAPEKRDHVDEIPPKDLSNTQEVVEDVEKQEYISGVQLWLVLASVTLVAFVMLLDMSIIAIPQITNDFHSLGDVGWYGSAFLLAKCVTCALQPLAGRLYTLTSYKYTFLAFLFVFEVGSAVCGSAQSSKALIVGRAVAGIGGSGIMNGALTIVSASSPIHKQPLMVGTMMGLSQMGIVCGPLVGGAFTQGASWRWCFYVNLPIGALAAVLLLTIRIPDHRSPEIASGQTRLKTIVSKLDLTGFLLFAGFAIMIELALSWGGSDYPWSSPTAIGLFCGAGVSLAIFVAWEHRVGDDAMIPGSVACRSEVWSASLYLGFFSGALLCFSYYMPIYFQAVKGASALMSGVYLLSGILPQLVMAILSGALIGKMGYYLPWALGSSAIMLVGAGLTTTLTVQATVAQWVMYQFVAGFGRGCGMQTPVIAIQNTLPAKQIPLGMSLVIFTQTFGGSLALTIAQLVFNSCLEAAIPKFAPTADVDAIIYAGATGFSSVVTPDELPGVLRSYAYAIDKTFYVALGASAGTFLFAWGMGWRKIQQKKGSDPSGVQIQTASGDGSRTESNEA
ncbi:efflux pump [Colletotrichum orchidophilum]|uniref:Efflux pump n=1 Tax=Colletotrichum orchidophilum TaxID=1209926 RepID=A0A1G4BT18_9PEZI|nr:efflux pump [Colletotrichum orchidophilum]OHF04572.1 efflux pump [Colletotrichum orchidophilum]